IACGCKVVKEVVGEVEKEGVAYDIVHLSMERNEWFKIREKKKYEKINFDVFKGIMGGGKGTPHRRCGGGHKKISGKF
ncbi:MAG: hypothetical protein IKN12_11315, partial [Selenomonadaceae bacterium]|nr:hypothetical protein [Selenomonadaceae bacterium]